MDFPFTQITQSAGETQTLGEALGHTLLGEAGRHPVIVCLRGELGSGKTTFTQGLAKGLGIRSRMLSPTFIIVRRYGIPETSMVFHHIDLYRLETEKEIEDLGFLDMARDPHAITVIEWPERLGTLIPENRIEVGFTAESNGSHVIRGKRYG